MGSDTPIAVLSDRPRLMFEYFSQLFAQVTNPPLDAIREELVTSLSATIGPEQNLLEPTPQSARQITLGFPIISNDDLAKLVYVNEHGETPGFKSFVVDGLYEVAGGGAALARALERICAEVIAAIDAGANIVILSDRHASAELAPIPSLLLVSAVHQHLVREKARARAGLIVESGDARETHHMALLVSYGAAAVNPYLAVDSVVDMARRGVIELPERRAVANYVKAAGKGVLKVMSKMGISTIASYTGAQVFEAIGLDRGARRPLLHGHDEQARRGRARRRGRGGRPPAPLRLRESRGRARAHREIEIGGDYHWRRDGEHHLFNPATVFKLQQATRENDYRIFKQYTHLVDDQSEKLATLRGLLRLRTGGAALHPPVPLDEVEPVESIIKRFATGAMSYGSISSEAHETLAVAMNRLGARSNSGEGGEDPSRYVPRPERRLAPVGDEAGRLGALRGDERVPDERRRPADQDGPGGQAGRGRPAARPEGLPLDRQDPVLDARCRADLAPAAPRHLLDRGPRPADPRPEERQQPGPDPREARRRGRRRDGRRGCRQGARRRRAHLRARTAAPGRRRSPRSSTPEHRGSSGSPRPSRPSCATPCATGSSSRSTAR